MSMDLFFVLVRNKTVIIIYRKQLFCKLTWRHLNKEPHHIMKHVEGKKFKRAYAKCKFPVISHLFDLKQLMY